MRQRVETTTNRQETMATTWNDGDLLSPDVIECDWRDKSVPITE